MSGKSPGLSSFFHPVFFSIRVEPATGNTFHLIVSLPDSCFFCLKGKEKVADARRKELSKNSKSDHLTVVNAFQVGTF